MKRILFLFTLISLANGLLAQYVYTIKADSVKITNCDSAELILENHTQNIPGFLFNTGNGRTIFKRAVQPIGNGFYVFGADTLQLAGNSWVQGGNSFGATGILGTLDNNHLDLYSNDTQRIRLTNTGDLLIGSASDSGFKLQVNGNGHFNGSGSFNGAGSFGGTVYLNAPPDPATGDLYFLIEDNQDVIGGSGPNMIFQVPQSYDHYAFNFGVGPNLATVANCLQLTGPSPGGDGNITISSPSSFIDLYNVQDIGVDASGMSIVTGGYNGQAGLVVARNARSTSMTDPILTVVENNSTVLDALKNGNIGIGTATPAAQLHTTGSVRFAGLTSDSTQTRVLVSDASGNLFYRTASSLATNDILRSSLAVNGTITAKQLVLRPKDWPDYVFDSSYRLTPLPAIENYILQRHHLPGFPSAQDVGENGTDVGDNQAVLLKKVEELTLYIIEQNKKTEQQNKEIESLKQEMTALKELITKKAAN